MKELKKKNQTPDAEASVECSKCHKEVSSADGVQKTNGFVCSECVQKVKKRTTIGVLSGLILIAGLMSWLMMGNKQRTGDGFEGVGEINDSISVIVDSNNVKFELSATTAISTSVSTQNPISNLEDFKHTFAEIVSNANEENSTELVIPSISILFEINTNYFKNEGEVLVREFASAYAKTNKKATILVEGYTCDLGNSNLNDRLSAVRVQTVKKVLIDAGIPENMIETKWYGKSRYSEFNYPAKSDYRCVILSIR